MNKKLIFVGETVDPISYSSNEELNDKISDKKLEIYRKSVGADTSVMAGAYESSVSIPNGDSSPVVFNTVAGVVAAAQVAAGVTARIWEFTVPVRYFYVWGSGLYGAINNQGYLYFLLAKAATGFQSGKVTLSVETYDRHRKVTVRDFQDANSHMADFTSLTTATPTNNQARMIALPQTKVIAQPYSRLVIDYQVLTAQALLDTAAFSIPVTIKSI